MKRKDNGGDCVHAEDQRLKRTKVRRLALVLTTLLCLAPASVFSGDWSPAKITDWPGFLLGMAGGVTAHELGHVLVARTEGYSIHHDGVSITYSPDFRSRADHLRIASAGFQGQWLAAETAFAAGNKNNNLAAGIICGHLATSFAYLVVLKDHPRGDTVGMAAATGLTVNQVAALLALPAALDAWRLFGHDVPGWVPGLSLAIKGSGIAAVWMF